MIVLYGYAEGCPACDDAKQHFKDNNIEFHFVDLQHADTAQRQCFRDRGFKTVPIIQVGTTLLPNLAAYKGMGKEIM